MTLSFNNELDAIFQEKERYRIYLIYYSGALLVLLTYLGFKLKTATRAWSIASSNAPRNCPRR